MASPWLVVFDMSPFLTLTVLTKPQFRSDNYRLIWNKRNDIKPDEPIPIRSADWPSHPHIRIQRNRFKDDAHLPVIKITVTRQAA
ncbi:MAG: hypothetical protein CMJ19_05655 [Phycisphaeraceae bacterium]|nr:hypothetical protein [Phycisphaeraceae bacterium]